MFLWKDFQNLHNIYAITQQPLDFSVLFFCFSINSAAFVSISSWIFSGFKFVESNKKSKAPEHIDLWEEIDAARKSTSSSFKCSIPGLIFWAADIQLFLALSADKYLKKIY